MNRDCFKNITYYNFLFTRYAFILLTFSFSIGPFVSFLTLFIWLPPSRSSLLQLIKHRWLFHELCINVPKHINALVRMRATTIQVQVHSNIYVSMYARSWCRCPFMYRIWHYIWLAFGCARVSAYRRFYGYVTSYEELGEWKHQNTRQYVLCI